MKIINPLYDTAFKYLMQNNQTTQKVLSTSLECEVLKGFEDIVDCLKQPVNNEEFRNTLKSEEEIEAVFRNQEAEIKENRQRENRRV